MITQNYKQRGIKLHNKKIDKNELILNDSLEEMKKMNNESIDIVVTSPPYNIGKNYLSYKDNKSQEEYLEWIYNLSIEIKRILKKNGSYFLNIGSTNRNPSIYFDVFQKIKDLFFLQNDIIWLKSITVNNVTHGYYTPITSKRFLNNLYEKIFHFTKNNDVELDRLSIGVPFKDKYNINRWQSNKEDKKCIGNVWFIPYKNKKFSENIHCAAFPEELVEKCIKLHGYNEETIVLDPFLGSGTTLYVCKKLNIKGIGIEIDENYLNYAINNLSNNLK
jgi:site-specific DNA-methyltransferase (adenine-specific)